MVIAGKDRGQSGTIVRAMPRPNTVFIDGINLVMKHRKPSAQNRKGQIADKPMPIHASNVMLADPKSGKSTRIKITRGENGARQRVAVKSGQQL